jgi:DNA-binding MarR family transcriptional regulator
MDIQFAPTADKSGREGVRLSGRQAAPPALLERDPGLAACETRRSVGEMVAMSPNHGELSMQCRPVQLSAVESHLTYWVHYVGYRVFHALRRRTLELGVTAAESVVLRKLYEHENGEMPSRLALRLGLTRGYLSRLAMRLEAKGLIDREKSLSDRRALILTLTGVGRAVVHFLAEMADQVNARTFGGADGAPHEIIEKVMKWIVFRGRFRFVPPQRCCINRSTISGP